MERPRPGLHSLHTLFEAQYQAQWTALDEIAERIRAVGLLVPEGAATFGNLTAIRDGDPTLDATAMLEDLLRDNDAVLATLRPAFSVSDRPATLRSGGRAQRTAPSSVG